MHIKAYEYIYIYIYIYIYMIYILPRQSLALHVINPTRRDIRYSVPPEALRVAVAGQQHSSG